MLPIEELFASAAARFHERATDANPPRNVELWKESIEQRNKGWLPSPVRVAPGDNVLFWGPDLYNVAFRRSVQQGEKRRACDDLRHSLTNFACAVSTPIRLISRRHVTAMVNEFRPAWGLCRFFICDRKSEYKALPVAPKHTKFSAVVLKFPIGGLFYAFARRTLLRGSIASVIRYRVFA